MDTEGFVLKARVHPADEHDAEGAKPLLAALRGALPRLALIWVDGGDTRRFAEWVAAERRWRVEAVQHPEAGRRWVWGAPGQEPPPAPPAGFRVRKRRWVIERTFAWLGINRCLGTDDAVLPATEEAWIDAASNFTLWSSYCGR